MTHVSSDTHESFPDNYHDSYSKTTFGFWLYLVTDFVLFGALFAVYLVLHRNTFGGPSAKELFHLPSALGQTLILLGASLTSGLAGGYAHRNQKNRTIFYFAITFLLGLAFMKVEFAEFSRIIKEGSNWEGSAFLSSYFTLVATHGVHVLFALLWIIVLLPPVFRFGISPSSLKRLTCLRMFWQFINIIWVFIFTIVYLMGRV